MADALGFKNPEALFEVVGKDEYSLRHIETWLRPVEPAPDNDAVVLKRSRAGSGGVLVVGIDSLLTTLAKCCRPAPPDAIAGYVTRGKGVAIHRERCSNFRHMAAQAPDRVIAVAWGDPEPTPGPRAAVYPLDVAVEATDRQGLLRDISEAFTREKVNLTGVNTQSHKGTAWMTFTVELTDAHRLPPVLAALLRVPGVKSARRR
jgi:GTP pyrophosphokinase